MNILMVVSEAAPYLRTGDVANVVMALSIELRSQGHDVRVVIPRYHSLTLDITPHRVIDAFEVPMGEYAQKARLWRTDYVASVVSLPVYLIENQFYFGRENAYGYLDDYERFIFFTRAVVELLEHPDFSQEQWQPDIIHGHDWNVGLLPMWLRHTYRERYDSRDLAFVYTIHNAGFPGRFGYRAINVAGLADLAIYESIGETPSRINFMARGILAANAVNTVSRRHAEEILHEQYARDLAQALHVRNKQIVGILNGLDYSRTGYNPAFDDSIRYKYDQHSLEQRSKNKQDLQRECGLNVMPKVPLLGMVSRLIEEKGIGLLEPILKELAREGVQLVIIGAVGDHRYSEFLTQARKDYPGLVAPIFTSLDDPRARRLHASADIILVPSLREPCGSQQMIAMRYGALPLVHRTGGLADTVAPADEPATIGRGFLFDTPDHTSLLHTIHQALDCLREEPGKWREMQQHNMRVEFSWSDSARKYLDLYAAALEASRRQRPLAREHDTPIEPDRDDLLVNAILEVSELAMTIDQQGEYLKQVARSARELLQSDAVLIWTWNERDPQRLSLEGFSFKRDNGSQESNFDPGAYRVYLEQDGRSWQYIYRLDRDGDIQHAQLGFLESGLAHRRNWGVQLSVPMNTHGTMLGRIDAFFHDLKPNRAGSDKLSEPWAINALGAFASAVAVNLEKTRLNRRTERLLAVDRALTQAQTVEAIAQVVLLHAKELTRAHNAYLQLGGNRLFSLEDNHFGSHSDQHVDEEALRSAYGSVARVELPGSTDQPEGLIIVVRQQPVTFSHDDEGVLILLATQAANVLQAVYVRELDDQRRVDQLRKLASSLVGGGDFDALLTRVVETTAEALRAEAASLYLIDPELPDRLVIRAASGYHAPLLAEKASYKIGEGTTGWIAKEGVTVRVNSLEELRARTPWKGKHLSLQGTRNPNVFLGIPLQIADPITRRNRVIGVLKLEDRKKEINMPFTDQDERLGEMMANVIATVIQNTRQSDLRLRELNASLQAISSAMVGGMELSALVGRIVDTIAEVVGADASSLYLIEPNSQILKIQAATGYQRQLVQQGASYELNGPGITAWIAREGKSFVASSVEVLHDHPKWAGKHNPGQRDREPNAFLGIPLKVVAGGRNEPIGVLKVEDIRPSPRHPEPYFTEQDQLLVEMIGNVITTVIQNTRLSDIRLSELNASLQAISSAMVGGMELSALVGRIVDTIAEVVGADASSLYLIEPNSQVLKIQAATGYQRQLVQQGASYELNGAGITAWIARKGAPFKANSLAELRQHPAWTGKHNPGQGGREPNAFLGIPLTVVTAGAYEEVIGVLKVEDIRPGPRHPEHYFTQQDQLLVEMMGNVITTVIQNTRLGDIRLRELNATLEALSSAMVGGLELSALVGRIVDTIAEVVGADASSLYLIEPGSQVLKIQAATGYQRQLVQQGAAYDLNGNGVTAWIAREGKPFKANSVAELHQHPAWAGKHNPGQGGLEPSAFLGIPLKSAASGRDELIGVLKVEDIRPGPRHPEPYFTEQDQLLIEMMGNVITTVIQNTRLGDIRLQEFAGGFQTLLGTIVNKMIATGVDGMHRTTTLVKKLVEATAQLLGADASSLYVVDPPGSRKLTIWAATGYHESLIRQGVTYDLYENSITAWIAREGRKLRADSSDELRNHIAWAWKYRDEVDQPLPETFLGVPLRLSTVGGSDDVTGVFKVEYLRPGPRHPEPHFTEKDERLVETIGTLIATIIQNGWLNEINLRDVLAHAFTDNVQIPMSSVVGGIQPRFVDASDETALKLISTALVESLQDSGHMSLEDQTNVLIKQTQALLSLETDRELYRLMAERRNHGEAGRWYARLYELIGDSKIDPRRTPEALVLARTWQEASEATGRMSHTAFGQAVEKLATAITQACGGRSERIPSRGEWLAFQMRDILFGSDIRVPSSLPVVCFQGAHWQPRDDHLASLGWLLSNLRQEEQINVVGVMLFLPTDEAHQAEEDLRRELEARAFDLIFLTLDDLQRIVCARVPQQQLRRRLLQGIDLLTVSPYIITGPVPDTMFFGRDHELRQIREQVAAISYAVIGGRRVGKSSLLLRLHRVSLADRFRTLYFDCSATLTYEEFRATYCRDLRPPVPDGDPLTLGDLLQSPPADRPLVLLLDEADKLIDADRAAGWPLFNALRAFTNSERGRLVLSGERALQSALREESSTLFNLANELLLGPLDYDSVRALVSQPMRQLEIELADEQAIVARIWEFTSGHPNVVQRFCRRLIERINTYDKRSIDLDDVAAVIADPSFQEKDFLDTYWERATPLERIITLLMAQDKKLYRPHIIQQLLSAQDIHTKPKIVRGALNRLVELRSILQRRQDGYEFAVEAFPRVLNDRTTAEDLLIELRSEYLENPNEVLE